jgi:hypothetical protein
MTFSRLAAAGMTRRVERICAEALGANGGTLSKGLAWAGTFHGVGARLLREYATEIGLNPDFTIHDREDAADLMNLVRHELGLSKTESRFPTKGTCLAFIPAPSTRSCRSTTSSKDAFLGALPGAPNCASCSPLMSRPSRRRTFSITTTYSSIGRRRWGAGARRRHWRKIRSRPRG